MSWLDATADLLRVARETLREQVMPTLKSDARYEAAMVGNAVAIAIREIEVGDRVRAEERAAARGIPGHACHHAAGAAPASVPGAAGRGGP